VEITKHGGGRPRSTGNITFQRLKSLSTSSNSLAEITNIFFFVEKNIATDKFFTKLVFFADNFLILKEEIF
jgi:hypothetical protein